MDEERLGIGVAADPSGLDDLEDAVTQHLDRLERATSGRVIDGPTIRTPEVDTSSLERASSRAAEFREQLDDISLATPALTLAFRPLDHVPDSLEDAQLVLQRFGATLADLSTTAARSVGGTAAQAQELVREMADASNAITTLPEEMAQGAHLAVERLDEISTALRDVTANMRDLGDGHEVRDMVEQATSAVGVLRTELASLGEQPVTATVKANLDDSALIAAMNNLQQRVFSEGTEDALTGALNPAKYAPEINRLADLVAQGLERAPEHLSRALSASVSGFLSDMNREIGEAFSEALEQRGVVQVPVAFRPETDAAVEVRADTAPFEQHVADAKAAVEREPPVEVPVVADIAPDAMAAVEDKIRDLAGVASEGAIVLRLDPVAAATLNTALDEARRNAELARQDFASFAESARPALEGLGISAERATPLVQALWDAMLRGQIVVEPTTEALTAAGQAADTLATKVQTLDDRFAQFNATTRATGQAGAAGIAPSLPAIVPPDLAGPERDFQILATGLADVSEQEHRAAAEAASLREVMTSSGQAARAQARENAVASAQLSDLGAATREGRLALGQLGETAHHSSDELTFHGLAARKLTSSLIAMGEEAAEIHSPIIGVAESLAEITVGHGPLLAIVATVTALALAWKFVHGEADEATKAQQAALDSFIKNSEARRNAELVPQLSRAQRDALREDIEATEATHAHSGALGTLGIRIAENIRLWLEERRAKALNNALTDETIRATLEEAEARRLGAESIAQQRAQQEHERTAQGQAQAQARLNFERQVGQQEVDARRQTFGNEIEAARFAAEEGRRVDERFFAGRAALARASADNNIRLAEETIRHLRATEALSGPGIPEETETQRQAREAAIQAQEAEIRLQRLILAGNLAQIDQERELAELARQRAIATAQAAAAEREHQARVERAGGGNRIADFGGALGGNVASPAQQLALTTAELQRVASGNPIEIPLILQGAQLREQLGNLNPQFERDARAAGALADRVRAIGDGADDLLRVAENLNVIGQTAEIAFSGLINVAEGIVSIGAANKALAAARETGDAGQIASAQLDKLTSVVGAITAGVGVLTTVVQGLFGESEHDRIIRENSEKLEQLSRSLDHQATAEEVFTAQQAAALGAAERLAALQIGPAGPTTGFEGAAGEAARTEAIVQARQDFMDALDAAGLTLEQFAAIVEQQTGLQILDDEGHLVAGTLAQADEALRHTIEQITHFSDTLETRARILETEDALGIGGRSSDERVAALQRTREIELEGLKLDPATEARIRALDLETEAGREAFRAFNAMLLREAEAGNISAEELEKFSNVDQLLDPINQAADQLKAFEDATKDATDRLQDLNIPAGFRREALAFEVGAPGTPFAPRPPGPGEGLFPPTGPIVPQIDPHQVDRITRLPEDLTISLATGGEDFVKRVEAGQPGRIMAEQLLNTLRVAADLQSAGVAGAGAGTRTITGGLHITIPVTLPGGAALTTLPPSLQLEFERALRQALANIGLVQSGDTLQLNAD